MFKSAAVLFLYTETPFHPGTGSNAGSIDLPIQRERHTKHPRNQASGVKGAFRDLMESLDKVHELERIKKEVESQELTKEESQVKEAEKKELEEATAKIEIVFGPTDNANEHGGALSFSDANILLFPVASVTGTFAWVTCPMVIERFKRSTSQINKSQNSKTTSSKSYLELEKISFSYKDLIYNSETEEPKVFVTKDCKVKNADGSLVLEEFAFRAETSQKDTLTYFAEWLSKYVLPQEEAYQFWREKIKTSLVLVDDDMFRYFTQFCTEVLTRIKIGETGTVQKGALWTEELIPADTLFYAVLAASDAKKENPHLKTSVQIINHFNSKLSLSSVVQLGGDATLGRGFARATLLLNENSPTN